MEPMESGTIGSMTKPQTPRGSQPWLWFAAVGLCLSVLIYWCASLKFSPEKTRTDPPFIAPTSASPTVPTIKKGTWRVGVDVQPGTYTATVPNVGNAFCIWTRLNKFQPIEEWTPKEGEPSVIIKTGTALIGETVTVKILSTDVAFETQGCGTWTKVG